MIVSWGKVPAGEQNGIIIGYRVFYLDIMNNAELTITVNASLHQVNISKLREYHKYNVTILAFTKKGDGPRSEMISARTHEDGKA